VRDVDFIDLLRLIACRTQIRHQVSRAVKSRVVIEFSAGAGVDQDQLVACINEKGVIGHVDGIGEVVFGKAAVDFIACGFWQYMCRRISDHAVIQCCYFEIAEHEAVKAGRLRLYHRRCSMRPACTGEPQG